MIYMDVDTALSEVPVNVAPLTDDTDFKSIETGVAYNASGMALYWHFVTPAGAYTVTAVTPTTGGNYDWAHQNQGMYSIEIPASGGASINNDTEGFGWFTGVATGVLPWRGPTICFRAAGLNDALVESAWSTTRGLAGTALPAAAAEASGGLATLSAAQASNGTINANVHRWMTGTPNALQSGRVDSYIGAVATGVIAAASFAANALDAVWSTSSRTLSAFAFSVTVGTNNDKTGYALSSAGNLAVWDVDTSAIVTSGSIGKRIVDYLTGDVFARLGAPTGASVSADVADLSARLPAALVSGRMASIAQVIATGAVDAAALAADAVDEIWDVVVEGSLTARGAVRLALAALTGKASGLAGTTARYRDNADTKDRIVATVDADGNRTAVTLDAD